MNIIFIMKIALDKIIYYKKINKILIKDFNKRYVNIQYTTDNVTDNIDAMNMSYSRE